ncbi:preprotein translocase subunit YajC [Paractinoplanes maris]|uniref:preprotein translocase subunit YajC n=1 Tax=Paractinoplanes maris TaxID=1734446 RepID=UPI0020205AE0|nr:preprotein translocase subunit YajC [Actinoplanes maris]
MDLAAEASGGGSFTPLLLIVLLFAVMYFLMIRPQQKRRREAQQMQNTLGPGDRIVTIGGLHGTVVAIADDVVTIEIADGVHVDFARPAIARVVTSTAAAPASEEIVEPEPEPLVDEPIVNPVTDTRKKD